MGFEASIKEVIEGVLFQNIMDNFIIVTLCSLFLT